MLWFLVALVVFIRLVTNVWWFRRVRRASSRTHSHFDLFTVIAVLRHHQSAQQCGIISLGDSNCSWEWIAATAAGVDRNEITPIFWHATITPWILQLWQCLSSRSSNVTFDCLTFDCSCEFTCDVWSATTSLLISHLWNRKFFYCAT